VLATNLGLKPILGGERSTETWKIYRENGGRTIGYVFTFPLSTAFHVCQKLIGLLFFLPIVVAMFLIAKSSKHRREKVKPDVQDAFSSAREDMKARGKKTGIHPMP